MLSNADLLKGVGDNDIFVNEENFGAELPLEDAEWDYVPASEEENEVTELEQMDQSELVDLLEDSRIFSRSEEEVEEDTMELIHEDKNNSQDDEPSVCEPDVESVSHEVLELTSDEEGRPMRHMRKPVLNSVII